MKWLEDTSDRFKSFILAHGDNPYFWTILFFLGILVFVFTYRALNRHK